MELLLLGWVCCRNVEIYFPSNYPISLHYLERSDILTSHSIQSLVYDYINSCIIDRLA